MFWQSGLTGPHIRKEKPSIIDMIVFGFWLLEPKCLNSFILGPIILPFLLKNLFLEPHFLQMLDYGSTFSKSLELFSQKLISFDPIPHFYQISPLTLTLELQFSNFIIPNLPSNHPPHFLSTLTNTSDLLAPHFLLL